MKVGIFITNQQTLDTDMVSPLEGQYAMVRCARDRGWDSVMTGQHYLNEGNNKQLQIVPFLARAGLTRIGEKSGGSEIAQARALWLLKWRKSWPIARRSERASPAALPVACSKRRRTSGFARWKTRSSVRRQGI